MSGRLAQAGVMCAALLSAGTVLWVGSYSRPPINKANAERAAANRLKQLCDRGLLQQACGYFVFVHQRTYDGKPKPRTPNAWSVEYRNHESHVTMDFLVHADGRIEAAWNKAL